MRTPALLLSDKRSAKLPSMLTTRYSEVYVDHKRSDPATHSKPFAVTERRYLDGHLTGITIRRFADPKEAVHFFNEKVS